MNNIEKLQEWYRLQRRREFLDTHDQEAAWASIQQRIAKKKNTRIWTRWASIAAMVVVLIGAGWWYASTGDNQRTISVPMGAEYSERMADGTTIIMNAGTKLNIPSSSMSSPQRGQEVVSSESPRKVDMTEGEVYFEVAHNEDVPFIVNTPTGTIEVLGTHFNVVADAECTTVTLEEGSVRLHFNNRQYTMKPGEQARMKQGGAIDIRHVNSRNYTSWASGTYEFENATLDEITRQLSLWYDIDITINDKQLENTHYTGAIYRNESLDEAIHTLTTISDLKFQRQGRKLTVY